MGAGFRFEQHFPDRLWEPRTILCYLLWWARRAWIWVVRLNPSLENALGNPLSNLPLTRTTNWSTGEGGREREKCPSKMKDQVGDSRSWLGQGHSFLARALSYSLWASYLCIASSTVWHRAVCQPVPPNDVCGLCVAGG